MSFNQLMGALRGYQANTVEPESVNPSLNDTAYKEAYLRSLQNKIYAYTLSAWILYFFVSLMFLSFTYLYMTRNGDEEQKKKKSLKKGRNHMNSVLGITFSSTDDSNHDNDDNDFSGGLI